MTTFFVFYMVAEIMLEIAVAYLVYKQRYRLMGLVRDMMGTSSLRQQVYSMAMEQEKMSKTVRRIRKHQRRQQA